MDIALCWLHFFFFPFLPFFHFIFDKAGSNNYSNNTWLFQFERGSRGWTGFTFPLFAWNEIEKCQTKKKKKNP